MARVFVSYSHIDQGLRTQLDVHMAMLKRQDHAEVWTDHCIRPGEPFDARISDALEAADVILLLVSPEFLHSDYCVTIEMQRALVRARAGEAEAIGIILRPCDWKASEIAKLKVLPTDGLPVVKFPTYDDGFHDVVTHLRAMLTRTAQKDPFPKHTARGNALAAPALKGADATVSSFVRPDSGAKRSSNLSLPRQFSDLERANFIQEGYRDILDYFMNSLAELEKRYEQIHTKVQPITNVSFTATIFSNGKKMAGCGIRLGGLGGSDGITYVGSDEPHMNNSANETLMVTDNKHLLGWKSMFGGFMTGKSDQFLTHEGAAEHLWEMFVKPLQSR